MNRIDEKADELTELRRELGEIELNAMEYTLADAMRDGSRVTEHAVGSFGNGATACGLTAAIVGAKSAGYIK